MDVNFIKSTAKKLAGLRIITFLIVLVLIQGCSAASTNSINGGQSGEKAAKGKENMPSVLNYGYIGLNKLNLPTGAAGWGFHKGIIQDELKKHGITKINLTAFPNGPDLNESLISGRLNFGSLGDTPAILAKASGADTRLIAQPLTKNVGYLIGKKNGPKTIKDLEGKTIAIQKGSFMHRYVVGLLKQEGVKNYKLVHMLIPDAQAALARGEVDAMTNTGVSAIEQLNQGYVHLDDALSHPDLLGSSVTVVSGGYLKLFPDFEKVWNEAIKKSYDDLKQHPDEYYKLMADITEKSPELVKEASPIDWIQEEPFTKEGLKLLTGTKEFLVQEKLAQKDFNINDWVLK